ncbi:hypothetical protein Celaphus_00002248 [Cervus elaphus hippelaphus]|uniref:Uncharacterized protein n=1 Tax=Cervus elaphus hippelaphus TaxID=46360 RepID=A0A212CHD1_CEREH|nr:hypothetical protein Celaphus_00002248 [Cervus elaphus hippelaphus]
MEKPSTASGRQDRAETTSASCAFCLRLLPWKQKTGKKDHRGIDCGGFPIAIQDKVLHPDSVLGSDRGHSCCCASRIGLQSSKCENCGTKIHNSQRGCSKESPKEFHYRYNTPGQNFFNHRERSAFARLHYLNENNSSPTNIFQLIQNQNGSVSREQIPNPVMMDVNPYQESQTLLHSHPIPTPAGFLKTHPPETLAGTKKRNLSMRASKNVLLKQLVLGTNIKTHSLSSHMILNSSLDHALRTATILKQTTDQMIRTIAEDLAKVQRWRKKLKY